MQVNDFLKQISDEHGALQGLAAETIERMSPEDFQELMWEMRTLVRIGMWVEGVPDNMKINKDRHLVTDNHEMWRECPVCGFDYDLKKDSKCPECALEHPLELALVYEFNPTNKDSH